MADTESCADAGVALVAVPEVSGARTHGATRWLTPNRALIQLSLRYKWIDIFWFSFFHEAKHVLDQAKRSIVLDSRIGSSGTSEEVVAANRFAADFLIPPQSAARLRVLATESDVLNFTEELGIHPGIVVGRLSPTTTTNRFGLTIAGTAFDRGSSSPRTRPGAPLTGRLTRV